MDFILASNSPRRRELFGKIVPDFRVLSADVDERSVTITDPAELCIALAALKCRAVASSHPESCVIGCDTMVAVDGQLLGKPLDHEDELRMLRLLSGRTHDVVTGVCIEAPGVSEQFCCRTLVRFAEMTDEEMERYASSEEPYDKAGGYGIQGDASVFIEGIEGDYSNVVGFPVREIYRVLRDDHLL